MVDDLNLFMYKDFNFLDKWKTTSTFWANGGQPKLLKCKWNATSILFLMNLIEFSNEYEYIQDDNFWTNTNTNIFVC